MLAALTLGAASIDDAVLDRGADLAYRRALSPGAAQRRPPVDSELIARTRRVVNRVAATAPAVAPAARGFAWAVTVVANPEPSFVVYPRGRIIVHDAFVTATGWLDEELAAIVAHAIAHSLLGHDTQRIAQRAGAALDAADPSRRALAIADAAEALRTTRYSREELAAADALMIDLLVQAAYDPRAAGSAWRRARDVRPIAERMPIDDERLAAIDAAARAAVPRYEDVRAKTAAQGGGVRIPAGTHRAR